MNLFSYIIWNFNPEIYSGAVAIRWYGLLFALGFLISQQVLFYIYKQETDGTPLAKKNAEKMVENMTVYMIIATIIGARLGHVAFYQPQDYFTSFEGILRIFNIREGGLASHGATIAIPLVLLLFTLYRFNIKEGKASRLYFVKNSRGYSYLQIMDRIVIVVALTGALIRFGNFTNSEIIGLPTHSDKGVLFVRDATDILTVYSKSGGIVESIDYRKNEELGLNENGHVPINIYVHFKKGYNDRVALENYMNEANGMLGNRWVEDHIDEPITHNLDYQLIQSKGGYSAKISTYGIVRHPTQLYESFTTFSLFLLLFYIWSRKKKETRPGSLFGLFLVVLFTLRFLHEFLKENQVAFEDSMALNMGQWLSIPAVIFGILVLIYGPKFDRSGQGTGS
jgi:phosphatidylglycerol:prolipoprotein diacylglycerol transferase